MSDRDLIEEALSRLLAEHRADRVLPDPAFDRELWNELDALGFNLVGVPEAAGGEGGSPSAVGAVLGLTAAHAARVPIAEGLVAGWLCAASGLALPPGIATFGPAGPDDDLAAERGDGGMRLRGLARRVPWARYADHVVVRARMGRGDVCAIVPSTEVTVRTGCNLAGEPRDDLVIDTVVGAGRYAALPLRSDPIVFGAMARAIQIAGAVQRAVELSVVHVRQREQFGVHLSSFQLVRQQLAELAGEAAAAAAVTAEAMATGPTSPDHLAVAGAKIRAARAAGAVATSSHQLHGAIGFTDEHPLHLTTMRLWSWRDECGTQVWWERWLGRATRSLDPVEVWDGVLGELEDGPTVGATRSRA